MKGFLQTVLCMEIAEVNQTAIVTVSKAQRLPRSKVHDEVLVHLHTVEDCDLIYSYAKNLAKMDGKAGIRLDIPQHLRSEFKILETHGNMIRKNIGTSVKRSIRFDDSERSLILNMRLTADDPWVTVTVQQAMEAKRIRNQESIRLIRSTAPPTTSGMTSPLGKALGIYSRQSMTRPRWPKYEQD